MPTVHFYGEVLPRAFRVSLSNPPEINWEVPERGLSLRFLLEIKNSQVHITVHANKYSDDDMVSLYMRAWDIARTCVELVAFRKAWGVEVVLTKFVKPDGVEAEIVFNDPRLEPICKSYDLENGFPEMLKIVLGSPAIFSLLHDLIRAITVPHASTVTCARVVDGIKHLIASGAPSRAKEWLQMREALRVDETYVRLITDHSKDARHGKAVHIPGNVTSEIAKRAWTIMDRFLEYKKRNAGPLPIPEYPVLFG